MNKEKKNFIWNTIGLSFSAFISLFLLIVVKRINGINTAGIFTYAFSLCCLFFIISCFYSRTFQVSDYKRRFTLSDYFTARIIYVIISLLLILLFSIINGFSNYKLMVILLLSIYKSVEALSDSLFGQIQIEGNLYKTGISYTLKSILGLATFIVIDIITKNLLLSITGLFVVSIIVLILYDLRSIKEDHPRIQITKKTFINLSLITLPIFTYTFLQNYLSNSQKMLMTYFVPNKMQTVFGILIMPATMILLVGNYIIMPFINNLTEKYKEKKYMDFDKLVNKICISVFLIGIMCVVIAYYIGIPVLNIIYNIELDRYKMLLIIVLIGALFNSIIMVLSNVLTILTINKKQTIVYFVMSIFVTVLTIILANKYKIKGLCYAYLITFVALFVIYYILYKRQIRKLSRQS